MEYKLLTPGPLSTTIKVKREMLIDHCTWDNDYKKITQEIREELLDIANLPNDKYTSVLMQGSGTFAVESVITSVVPNTGKLLVLTNGVYGDRIGQIAKFASIDYRLFRIDDNKIFDPEDVRKILEEDKKISHVAMVHSETTTGILNNIEEVGKVVKEYNKDFIVDAMSSFGAVNIDIIGIKIDYLVSSANKCIQGVPGFAFVICDKEKLESSKGIARSLSLSLYDQYQTMKVDGKWRFTSPTHVVMAFRQALRELKEEGVENRYIRYSENNKLLNQRMQELGFKLYIDKNLQGPIISTFLYPDNTKIDFKEMYDYLKKRGYIIYPGKLTDKDSFRVGNIGEIYKGDIEYIHKIFRDFMIEKNYYKEKTSDKLNNIELVVFDWAGTAVDFGSMSPVFAFKKAFEAYKIDVTEEEIRRPMGMLKIDHIRTMLKTERISSEWQKVYGRDWDESDVEKIYEKTEEAILKTVGDFSSPKPYLLDAVEKLRERNINVGSTTGYTDEMMDIVTKRAKEEGYEPDFWISPNSVDDKGRPYPFMIYENMKKFGIDNPDKVIKIGDTISDIKEGLNAKVHTIGVLDGSSLMGISEEDFNKLNEAELNKLREITRQKFYDAGAEYVINNLSELIEIIE